LEILPLGVDWALCSFLLDPIKEAAMTVHLIKLCVGAESIEDLAVWQAGRLKALKTAGDRKPVFGHRTFQTPKRREDLLDGGSIYWIIKGLVQVRQRIVGLTEGAKDDGSPCCVIVLDKTLVPVRPVARRPFQGWRYLGADDAPADLKPGEEGLTELPLKMRKELAELGLI
jgi:hypothetical protein